MRPNKEESSPDVLDVEVENLYKDQNLDFIMDEVIDEKQNFLIEGQRVSLQLTCC